MIHNNTLGLEAVMCEFFRGQYITQFIVSKHNQTWNLPAFPREDEEFHPLLRITSSHPPLIPY